MIKKLHFYKYYNFFFFCRCSAIENLVQAITQEPVESDQLHILVQCLHAIFLHDLSTPIYTGSLTNE